MIVEYSQISPSYLKSILAEGYNMSKTTEVIFLHQGFNDTYKITNSKAQFILRIYRHNWKSYENIAGELELLKLLYKNHINVSYPIPDKNRTLIKELKCPEGVRYSVLFSFAQGKPLLNLDSKSARLFGEQMARIHNVTKNHKLKKLSKLYTPSDILSFSKSSLENRLGLQQAWINTFKKIEEILTEKLNSSLLNALPFGTCHGDPHYENCFINTNHETLTFFDFDFCGNGYLLYDLGSFSYYERKNLENMKNFFEGYKKIRSLSKMEIASIPYFEVLMQLFHLGARTKNADGVKNPLWPNIDIESKIYEIYNQLIPLIK